ncbi:MAG: tetratricopeptide repeat protein [Calditrichaeota bacterium]|nr:tetratricopeptide repeat protein [Calditrichota bacterium]
MKFLLFIAFFSLIFPNRPTTARPAVSQIDSVNAIPYEYIVSHLNESVVIFEKNVARARDARYLYGEAVALDKLSLAYGLSGKHDKANEVLLKAARIFEELNEFEELSMVYGGYGFGIKRRDLKSANNYMRQGIAIAEDHNLSQNLTTLYDNYGVLKRMEGKSDSAFYFFSKALRLKRQLKDSVGIPYSLNKLAEMLALRGRYQKALALMAESDAIRSKEEGEFGRAENLVHYGGIYRTMRDYQTAVRYYRQAVEKGKPLQYKYLVQYAYQQLTELYELRGDDARALTNYRRYVAYKDSVNNSDINNKIAELQIAYESEKKDRQLTEKALDLRNKSLQLFAALISIVLLSIIFFFIYRNYRQKQHHILKEVQWQNQLKQSELEQKLTAEKLRISRDLHDNIGSNLTFIINALDNLNNVSDADLLNQKLSGVGAFGRETLTDLRDTIWALKHDDGDTSLLVMKVQELKRKLNDAFDKPEIVVHNLMEMPAKLSSAAMLNLYRMIQEALQNAVKHARASRVTVTFSRTESEVCVTVHDDGNGFDPQTITYGNGLENMKNRCEALEGKFTFVSSAAGTRLTFTVPAK